MVTTYSSCLDIWKLNKSVSPSFTFSFLQGIKRFHPFLLNEALSQAIGLGRLRSLLLELGLCLLLVISLFLIHSLANPSCFVVNHYRVLHRSKDPSLDSRHILTLIELQFEPIFISIQNSLLCFIYLKCRKLRCC